MWRLETLSASGGYGAPRAADAAYAGADLGAFERAAASGGAYVSDFEQEYIVVGDDAVFVSDIAAFRVEDVVERDLNGLIAVAGLTLNLSAVFLVGVTAFGWRSQFLIAVVLFFVLGVGSLLELVKPGRSRYQKLTLFVDGADAIEFFCADDAHVLDLVDSLNMRGIRVV